MQLGATLKLLNLKSTSKIIMHLILREKYSLLQGSFQNLKGKKVEIQNYICTNVHKLVQRLLNTIISNSFFYSKNNKSS